MAPSTDQLSTNTVDATFELGGRRPHACSAVSLGKAPSAVPHTPHRGCLQSTLEPRPTRYVVCSAATQACSACLLWQTMHMHCTLVSALHIRPADMPTRPCFNIDFQTGNSIGKHTTVLCNASVLGSVAACFDADIKAVGNVDYPINSSKVGR